MTAPHHHDALRRLAQAGAAAGVQLVRLTALASGNRYTAQAVQFTADGSTEPADAETLEVTNLAEPADGDGALPTGTEAVALDVEGRWVVFARRPSAGVFPARVLSGSTGGAYTVREQTTTGAGTFADAPDAMDLTAHNLAELSLGPGAAVDADTIVLVSAIGDNGEPPTVRYVFDHPAYAKYLD